MSESTNLQPQPKRVLVLTGFLGSGKTTLLNSILQENRNTRFAIIENEVGEIGIDGELIIINTDSFTELNNGCICCSLNDNFVDTLRTLSQRTDWDQLIIEATGIANPGGILAPFRKFPWTSKYFQTPEVICIADAQNIKEQLQLGDTAASQLAYGDKVYISKADLVEKEEIDHIKGIVRAINPFSQFHIGGKGEVPVKELLTETDSLRPIIPFVVEPETTATHTNDFNSIALEYDIPFDAKQLDSRLFRFLTFQAANVYRFKGIFHDPNHKRKIIIQSVMQSLFMDEGDNWKDSEPKSSKFVFIGKNLQKKGFDKMLRECTVKK